MLNACEELKRIQMTDRDLGLCVAIKKKEELDTKFFMLPADIDYSALGSFLQDSGLNRDYGGLDSVEFFPRIRVIGDCADNPSSGQIASVEISDSYFNPDDLTLSEFIEALEKYGFKEEFSTSKALGKVDLWLR